MTVINIAKDELKKMKEVGSGTEGRIFQYNKGFLLKIYRAQLRNILKADKKYIKIYNKDTVKIDNTLQYINYFISNGDEDLKVRHKEGLKLAIARQERINRSTLPLDIVYIDGVFAGCLLKKLNGIQIHKLTGMPSKYKKRVIKNVLIDIEELLNNYIYHIDLANSPYSMNLFMDENSNITAKQGHSHILVNPVNLKTNIIDLDGKSTVYMERYNYNWEQKCLMGLSQLIVEFLFKINSDEIKEIDEKYFELLKLGLKDSTAYKFASGRFESIKELKKELKLF